MRKIAILALILLAACTNVSSPEINVHTGSNGLTLTLDNPPKEIFAESPFSVTGVIANEGASDVSEGILTIGVEDDWIAMSGERTRNVALAGKSVYDPIGQKTHLQIDLSTKKLPGMMETVTTNILFTLCYPYRTYATAEICIDPDPLGAGQKVCKAGAVSLPSQGAPVTVSRIETALYAMDGGGVKPTFTFTLDNLGRGAVISPENVRNVCTGHPAEEMDKVSLRAFLADSPLECTKATLEKGRNAVRCTLKDGMQKPGSAYKSIVRIEMEYGYASTQSTQLLIRRW